MIRDGGKASLLCILLKANDDAVLASCSGAGRHAMVISQTVSRCQCSTVFNRSSDGGAVDLRLVIEGTSQNYFCHGMESLKCPIKK